MNQLVWRLHRNQVYFATAALGALALLLVVTGNGHGPRLPPVPGHLCRHPELQ